MTAVMDPPKAEDLRPNGAADDAADAGPVDLIIDAGGQLSMSVGGKKATTSTVRIVGGKVDVDGSLEKGQAIAVRLELVVSAVAFVDKTDAKTGQVTGCERQHRARVVGVSVL